MADATDSKSVTVSVCGFESHFLHFTVPVMAAVPRGSCLTGKSCGAGYSNAPDPSGRSGAFSLDLSLQKLRREFAIIERREVVLQCLGAADLLHAAVLLQQ